MVKKWLVFLVSVFVAQIGFAEGGDIFSVDFDRIPAGTKIGSPEIILDGDVQATGDVTISGDVSVGGGVVFPDGSVQTTAVDSAVIRSFTANAGIYDNRISAMTPPNPYSEICFKEGNTLGDVHVISEPPTGGQCEPGDIGWIIERDERPGGVTMWAEARVGCLLGGMRVLEPFEWQISCQNAGVFGIDNMTDNWEWSSNSTGLWDPGARGLFVPIAGNGSCTSMSYRPIATSTGVGAESHRYRCGV